MRSAPDLAAALTETSYARRKWWPVAPTNSALTQVTLLTLSTSPGHRGEVLVVADGEIDLCTGPALLCFLHRAMRHPSCRTMIVDLLGVRFLGARGIGVLLTIQLDAHAYAMRLALVADHRAVLRPLQVTATTDQLTLFPTVADARAA